MTEVTVSAVRQALNVDALHFRNYTYTARVLKTRAETTHHTIKAAIEQLTHNRRTIEVLDIGDHNATTERPNAPIRDRSHKWVRFRICYNMQQVEVVNMMTNEPVMIPMYARGTHLDPSTESYWSA